MRFQFDVVSETMSSRIRAYGLAIVTTGLAGLIDVMLGSRFGHSSGGLYVAAAVTSTWFGGLGPGLVVVALTAAISLIFSERADLALSVGVHGFDRLIFFAVIAVMVSLIRRDQRLLGKLNAELEENVSRRTAALQESNRQLESFCYTLAHDLRAPARAIQGFADLLIIDYGGQLDAEGKAGLERIRNSADRMGRLILDLLAYTDLARKDFRKQDVDLEKTCRNVLRLLGDEIKRTRAEIHADFSVKSVVGDSAAVERVLLNLIANAVKFAKPDEPSHVVVSSETTDGKVRVSVRDNGIGIDPKFCGKLFGVFERLSSTGGSGGTGIGLAMVKRNVEKMGGTVGLESKPGVGSCFWFELANSMKP